MQLRKACEQALEQLQLECDGEDSISTNILPSNSHFIQADQYFLPFDLACRSKNAKIVIIALDCLQVLSFLYLVNIINYSTCWNIALP